MLPEYFLLQLIYFSKSNSGAISSSIKKNLKINFQQKCLIENKVFKYNKKHIKILEEANYFHKRFVDINKLYDYYNERDINVTIKLVKALFKL